MGYTQGWTDTLTDMGHGTHGHTNRCGTHTRTGGHTNRGETHKRTGIHTNRNTFTHSALFTLSESEKDATKHETKAGMEISQCKMTNWPYLAQFASDLFGSKNKMFLKSKVG